MTDDDLLALGLVSEKDTRASGPKRTSLLIDVQGDDILLGYDRPKPTPAAPVIASATSASTAATSSPSTTATATNQQRSNALMMPPGNVAATVVATAADEDATKVQSNATVRARLCFVVIPSSLKHFVTAFIIRIRSTQTFCV
jgi:hypothetical protein